MSESEIKQLLTQIEQDRTEVTRLQERIDEAVRRIDTLQNEAFAQRYGLHPGDHLKPTPALHAQLYEQKWGMPSIARFTHEKWLLFERGGSHGAMICTPNRANVAYIPIELAQAMRKAWEADRADV